MIGYQNVIYNANKPENIKFANALFQLCTVDIFFQTACVITNLSNTNKKYQNIINYKYFKTGHLVCTLPITSAPLLWTLFCAVLQIKIFADRICSLFDQRNKRGISEFPCLSLGWRYRLLFESVVTYDCLTIEKKIN